MLLLLWDLQQQQRQQQQQQHLDGRLTMVAAQVDKFVIQLRLSENLPACSSSGGKGNGSRSAACPLSSPQSGHGTCCSTSTSSRRSRRSTATAFSFFLLLLFFCSCCCCCCLLCCCCCCFLQHFVLFCVLRLIQRFQRLAINCASLWLRLWLLVRPAVRLLRQHNSCFTPQPQTLPCCKFRQIQNGSSNGGKWGRGTG